MTREESKLIKWFPENNIPYWLKIAKKILQLTGPIPNHIAFVMDGNRRFARNNKLLSPLEGHKMGFEQLTKILDWCRELTIKEVTVYAFSIENFKRSKEEVNGLMEMAEKKFQELLDEKEELERKQLCVRFYGDLSLLSTSLQKLMAKIELVTRNYSNCFINICLAYTSQNEIERAMKAIQSGIKEGVLEDESISECLLEKCLDTRYGSEVDLFIRTSGEQRLSDFLLYQSVNTHLYFDNILWPEFNAWHLINAIRSYQGYHSKVSYIAKMTRAKGTNIRDILGDKKTAIQLQQDKFLEWFEKKHLVHLQKLATMEIIS
ncbi:Dehydrodolichyl diphosphate synthase [Strongyloides ratti]|uniref:Alkyl transferase n=1 Tax=Strongyloides ratti TaxID=34506 RepID=A0A090MZI5_STRRB|nr:Dehydrodolichyl diphosphate synthase [Strongyloides ratti]CEF68994.1 Dehydrodolichyl diphosphate synthase [Strongyloides ratti]